MGIEIILYGKVKAAAFWSLFLFMGYLEDRYASMVYTIFGEPLIATYFAPLKK